MFLELDLSIEIRDWSLYLKNPIGMGYYSRNQAIRTPRRHRVEKIRTHIKEQLGRYKISRNQLDSSFD